MEYTTNYQLPQWVDADRILRTDFNDSYQKIETALSGLQTEVDANTAAHAAFGNCRIYHSSYVGAGGDSTVSITFPAQPMVMVVADPIEGYLMLAVYGMKDVYGYQRVLLGNTLTWSGSTVSWFGGGIPVEHLNMNGRTYQVYALLAAEQ